MSPQQKGYISMDYYNIITPSSKFKHLSFEHYEYIIREITNHDAFHHGKKRNTGRTVFPYGIECIFYMSFDLSVTAPFLIMIII